MLELINVKPWITTMFKERMKDMKTEIRDKIFDFAYYTALNDATLQKAYGKEKSGIPNKVKDIVQAYIESLLDDNVPSKDFFQTAKEIDDVVDKIADKEIDGTEAERYFTFGNIQKLINMTAKYIFIASYVDNSIKEKFNECDCPMDSIMMQKVKEKYIDEFGIKNPKAETLLQIPLGGGKSSIDLSKTAWSKIQFSEYDGPYSRKIYDNFQKMVRALAQREGLCPLEYDFKEWGTLTY